MSASQMAVMLCGWGVKTGMVQTVWSMSEHNRGSYNDVLYKSKYALLYFSLYNIVSFYQAKFTADR